MQQLVKRKGQKESYDPKKLYASVFAACRSLQIHDEEAELVAETVLQEVAAIIKDADVVMATDLHVHVFQSLRRYNPDAAYLYDTHRDIS